MKITDELLKKVAEKSMQNAAALISDAEVLKEAKRVQRAYALYQFSMEEVGKALASVFLLVKISHTSEDIKEYKQNFTRHQYKIKKSALLDLFICQILHKGDYQGAMTFLELSMKEDEKKLDHNKNNSLYTSLINEEVKSPFEMISEKETSYIENRAKTRYGTAVSFVKMIVEHYKVLRNYQKDNDFLKSMPFDVEDAAKKFWNEIIE